MSLQNFIRFGGCVHTSPHLASSVANTLVHGYFWQPGNSYSGIDVHYYHQMHLLGMVRTIILEPDRSLYCKH